MCFNLVQFSVLLCMHKGLCAILIAIMLFVLMRSPFALGARPSFRPLTLCIFIFNNIKYYGKVTLTVYQLANWNASFKYIANSFKCLIKFIRFTNIVSFRELFTRCVNMAALNASPSRFLLKINYNEATDSGRQFCNLI